MPVDQILLLATAIGIVAFLYSSVGHAGASGYTAVLTLFGFLAPTIKPTSLVLNILVASIGTYQFCRAGHFSWKLFWPFAALSIPASFLGGVLQIPAAIIHPLIGTVLLFSAVRLFLNPSDPAEVTPPGRLTAFGVGAGIGLLSGLTGTGGGVFLTPLVLLCRWAKARNAAAVSVVFILVNSIAGLVGHVSQGRPVPLFAWWLAVAAVVGGTLGSHLGSRQFPPRTIRVLLASTLVIAGIKLVLTR